MLELIIERWTSAEGRTDYLWSLWQDGTRLHMGGPHDTADAAEAEARDVSLGAVGRAPDTVTRL